MKTIIKLRVGLKGQLNYISRLIKATRRRRAWEEIIGTTPTHVISNMNAGVLKIMQGRESGITLIKLMVYWLTNISGL